MVDVFEDSFPTFGASSRMCGALSTQERSPPATDILTARLRAKFYGAQVITYRPYVQKILELSSPGTVSSDRSARAVYAIRREGSKALINSTRAFHGLGGRRLIMTNVWGTPVGQPSRSSSRILRPPTQPPYRRQGAPIPPHQNAGVPKHACAAELVAGSGYQDLGVYGLADGPLAFELQP
ncbi:uncharacterized protein PAC_19284 [Phialocephala subalpina]|uniref:Uncharacterized protein n=1 Tax=Phialocephala subalpina TaxID=576137 RepID=A0A1L7XWG9_9HELO|nr:uncharacterized protein PAC_19284 [Phialocephala subalpina]